MKIIINKLTGQVLYATMVDIELSENIIAIEDVIPPGILIPFWDGEKYYETITPAEIASRKIERNLQYNLQQYDEMKPYDWYFTRFVRNGTPVPQSILDILLEIELRYDNLKLV